MLVTHQGQSASKTCYSKASRVCLCRMDPITGGKVDGDLFAKVKEVYHELPEALRATLGCGWQSLCRIQLEIDVALLRFSLDDVTSRPR